jgi:starvation-inducible DNA-binding protein
MEKEDKMKITALAIAPDAKAEIIEGLAQSLAETAVGTTKAQNFHWNVVGMSFGSLHALFEEIYKDHFDGQDELAERIKALEGFADGRMSEYLKRSAVKEQEAHLTDKEMVEGLTKTEETLAATLRALAEAADRLGDIITNDLAILRAEQHEKFAWMLRSHLQTRA